jgi:pimeloyl-ACP methyl ester carboxylesterase
MISSTLARPLFAGLVLPLLGATAPGTGFAAEPASKGPGPVVLREALAIRGVSRAGRTAFHLDTVEALVVSGRWSAPRKGDTLAGIGGTNQVWESVTSDADGWFSGPAFRGGYAFLTHVADTDQVVLLNAQGHSVAYVNGEPHAGDPYENGTAAFPIRLRKGVNEFLFAVGRGRLRARLLPVDKAIALDLRDPTLPDLVAGRKNDVWAAVVVVNATPSPLTGLSLGSAGRGFGAESTPVPTVPPMSTRKVGFRLRHSGTASTNRVACHVELTRKGSQGRELLHAVDLTLRLRQPDQTRKVTFRSSIDDSIQYYAITPARPVDPRQPARALVLSTHGASVEALGQAEAYAPKSWAHVVAPTNRRPYGFDWEEWGRMDALEVLGLAQRSLGTDPSLTYLTGHSMGGHGAWQLGVTFPDRFAAIAPSAGWISFFSYAGGRRDEATNALRQLVQRAATPSDTLRLSSNYLHQGIYILHGDADDNVPVSEARTMREALSKFHRDFTYHEQPGAGHWWGNACVDWPPIFDLFARHRIPADTDLRQVQFSTANPGISATCHWLAIEAQQRALDLSRATVDWDPNARRFSGRTENIARLSLGMGHVPRTGPLIVELDGQKLDPILLDKATPRVWFVRQGGTWKQAGAPSPALKGPHRYGPFKEAFNHRMVFVYGTQGTPDENTWSFNKARLDAESWWYRGNGAVDVLPDTAFDPARDKDRGVVLYGNADGNKAWGPLLGDSPVQVTRGKVTAGPRVLAGEDLACLFLRPRPGSDVACVAVVAGSGLTGMRLTDRVPYIFAGVAFPDCTVFGPEALSVGAAGTRLAGYFGVDWTVENGEFAVSGE